MVSKYHQSIQTFANMNYVLASFKKKKNFKTIFCCGCCCYFHHLLRTLWKMPNNFKYKEIASNKRTRASSVFNTMSKTVKKIWMLIVNTSHQYKCITILSNRHHQQPITKTNISTHLWREYVISQTHSLSTYTNAYTSWTFLYICVFERHSLYAHWHKPTCPYQMLSPFN